MPFIELNNAKINYERFGSGETLLFIQGVGCIGNVWKPQIDILQKDFDCIQFDNRGIGKSTGDTKNLTIEQMTDDTISLLDQLGIERAHIIGHSMGGVIAYELALKIPHRVLSLALICTLHRGKDVLTPTFATLKNGLLTNFGTLAMRRKAFARMVTSPKTIKEKGIETIVDNLTQIFGRDLAKLPPVAMKQFRALTLHDSSHHLHKLANTPSIVIAGRHDPIGRPSLGKKLAKAIHTKDFFVFEDSSHALTNHAAEKVNEFLKAHFIKNSSRFQKRNL